jgi:hypothetical protein
MDDSAIGGASRNRRTAQRNWAPTTDVDLDAKDFADAAEWFY